MATTSLMDFAQFEQLAIPAGAHLELHHGEVVTMTTPKLKHRLIQRNLRRLIEEASPEAYVDTEVGFRPLPDHEYWEADVAYLTAERFREADPEKNIEGSPDIVIEVLSPSNTAEEMLDREQTCLKSGSREFWIVDPRRHRIRVIRNDSMKTYERGEEVYSVMNFSIRVDGVFRYQAGLSFR